jgi:hypothetical protein
MIDDLCALDHRVVKCANESCLNGGPDILVPIGCAEGDGIVGQLPPGDYAGYFVSSCHNVYCSRACWASFCDD